MMTSDRIREIQQATAYPESHSVWLALLQVWNECSQSQSQTDISLDEVKQLVADTPEKNVGDLVWLDGYTSFAQQNSQEEFEIEKKEYRFDELSGERYPIYFVRGIWFDGRTGGAYDNTHAMCMYYIELK